MQDDGDSPIARKVPTAGSREAARADALRANLMRRKAQARERTESASAGGVTPPKPPGDA